MLALLLPGAVPSAGAEGYGETEQRLKTAGVEPGLREQIHAAIRRGVAWLRPRAGLLEQRYRAQPRHPGLLLLATLALRHAGLPGAVGQAQATLDALLAGDTRELVRGTYEAGLLGLLLHADGRAHPSAEELSARLGRGHRQGWWDYASLASGGVANLSTSQFACLGLWSAGLLGARPEPATWRAHGGALLATQASDGSWAYLPEAAAAGCSTYPTGTCMGLADLVLAEAALAGQLPASEQARWIGARHRALAALRRHAAWMLVEPGSRSPVSFSRGYAFYALEKVCLFVGLESVAGRRWYAEGARLLLDAQAADGSWSGTEVETALSLLFLLRASASYRPTTPRPVDAPPAVTPGAGPAPAAPPEPAAAAAAALVPALAQALLDRLEEALALRRPERLAPALDALRFVRRTYASYRPDGVPRSPAHASWCDRAQALLLRAALAPPAGSTREQTVGEAIALEALACLGATDARGARALLLAFEERRGAEPWGAVEGGFAWRSALLEALLEAPPPQLAGWLARQIEAAGALEWSVLSPLLVAAGGLGGLHGSERHRLVAATLRRLHGVLTGRVGDEPWTEALERDAHALVDRLSGGAYRTPDPGAGSRRALVAWWDAHRDADDPVWR